MKRNHLSLILWIGICLIFGFSSLSQAHTLSLETTSGWATAKAVFYKGESLYLNILADDATGIAGCAFTLTYPAGALTAPQISSEGLPINSTEINSFFGFTFLKDGTTYQTHRENVTVSGDVGKIYFSGAAINTTTGGAKYLNGGPIVLFTVKFTVKSDAPVRDYNFSLSPTTLNNTQAGYSASGETIPVLVGAVDKNNANWGTLTAAYPPLISTMTAATKPFIVSFDVPPSLEELIQKIYIGYYQRPADPGGLIYWANDYVKYGLWGLIVPFANAPESQSLYGTINSNNIEIVINKIYNSLFGRAAEPEGLKYWADEFKAGIHTPATIMLNILFGARDADLQSVNNKVIAAKLFTRTIDPDLDGANYQATYAGDFDFNKAREFLSTYAGPTTVPTQSQVTAYIRAYIADAGDPINTTYAAVMSGSASYAGAQIAPIPNGLSRSTPYSRLQIVSVPNWDVTVLDAMRGDAALRAIRATNPLTDPAPAEMEYLLVKIRAKSTYADSIGHSISKDDFRITGDRLINYPHASVVPPEPSLDATLPAGGETEGWVTYLVGIGEGNLILIFDELSNADEQDLRFIALDDGAKIGVDPALAAISPTDIGKERNNPAPLKQKMVNEDWEISVVDVIRGDAAAQMVSDANRSNTPPADGREYVVARIHLKYIGTTDTFVPTQYLLFRTTDSLNVLYEHPAVIDPTPVLDAALFPGGEAEGWIVTQVAKGETGIMLVIDVLNDFSGAGKRFASLEP